MFGVNEFEQSSQWARTVPAPAVWGHHSMDTNPCGNMKEGGNFGNTNWQRKAGHFEYGAPAEEMTTADTDTDAASDQHTWSACTSTSPSDSGPNDATDIEEGGFAQAVTWQRLLTCPSLVHCEHAETADEFDHRPMIMRGISTPAQFGTDHAMLSYYDHVDADDKLGQHQVRTRGTSTPAGFLSHQAAGAKEGFVGKATTLPSVATIPGFSDLYDQHVDSDDEFDQDLSWARTHHQPVWAQPTE